MLSIIIPSHRDPYLQKTIDSLLAGAQGKIEVIPVLDGYEPETPIKKDSRVWVIKLEKNRGMRGAFNAGLKKAKGDFIMKSDSHCAYGPGYDKVMTENCQENWLMIPRRYPLDVESWQGRMEARPMDYHYLSYPVPNRYGTNLAIVVWYKRSPEGPGKEAPLEDIMTFQGSCWLAKKDYFMKHVGYLNDSKEAYGSFSDEPQEIGLKYWLGGGAVKVVKTVWYAHLCKRPYHYQNDVFARDYKLNREAINGHTWSAKHWMNNEEPGMIHPFSWVVEKFWPIPGWPEDRKQWVFSEKA